MTDGEGSVDGSAEADGSGLVSATDGGAAPTEPAVDSRIQQRFEDIALARKVRWLGAGVLVGFLTYLFLMALEAVEWFRSDLTQYADSFLDALQGYFPFIANPPGIVVGEGLFGVRIDPGWFGNYWTFISTNDLLWDSTFFEDADSVVDYPIMLFTEVGGPFALFGQAGETLGIGFAGTIIGFPLALLFSVLGSGRVTPFPFNFLFRGVMSTIRAIPALVWVLIYIPLGGIGPTTATLAVATDTVGNLGRLFSDELEEIQDGPIEAMRTTGASKPQVIVFGMLAQVRNSFIAWTLYIFEINVRIAVGLGIIGAGGLGLTLNIQRRVLAYTNMMATILVIFVLIISVEMFSQRIRAYLRGEDPMGFVELIRGFPERMARSMLK